MGIYGTMDSIAYRASISCMTPVSNEPDELFEQVLEDERAATVEELRQNAVTPQDGQE
jgi:hypothetical protein